MKVQIATAVFALSVASAFADEKSCLTTAFTEYTRANFALTSQITTVMTIEMTIAQRRLQEQYCMRAAQCRSTSPIAMAALFSGCLREEAKDQ